MKWMPVVKICVCTFSEVANMSTMGATQTMARKISAMRIAGKLSWISTMRRHGPAPSIAAAALAAALAMLAHTSAQAVALTEPVSPANFADTALPGTTVAARPELAGTVLEDLITPFSFEGITGTVAWDISERWSFKSITAFRRLQTNSYIDLDASEQGGVTEYYFAIDFSLPDRIDPNLALCVERGAPLVSSLPLRSRIMSRRSESLASW